MGTETVIVYVLFCLLPDRAELIAWLFTAAVAITAGQRVVLGVALLRQKPPTTSSQSIEQSTEQHVKETRRLEPAADCSRHSPRACSR